MKLPLAKLLSIALTALLLSAAVAPSARAKGRLLVVEHPTKLAWLSADGALQALPLPFALSFTPTIRLNDPGHLVIVDRASTPGRRRLAIVPLDGSKPWSSPVPKKRVRRNQIIQLVRYLPSEKSLLFAALDMYRSAYFELRGGKRRATKAFARFRGKIFARHVLPSGALILLHVPGFDKRSERAASRHYTRKNPKARKQTIYVAASPQAKPRELIGGRYVENLWLRAGGKELLLLGAGKVDAAAGRKSYLLERLAVQGGGKAQRVTTLELPLRNKRGRINSVPPPLYVFDSVPWALIASKGPKQLELLDLRSGKRRPFALPAGHRPKKLLQTRPGFTGPSTRFSPYLVTERWVRMVRRGKSLYELKVIAVPSGKVVATYRYAGRGIKEAAYLP